MTFSLSHPSISKTALAIFSMVISDGTMGVLVSSLVRMGIGADDIRAIPPCSVIPTLQFRDSS